MILALSPQGGGKSVKRPVARLRPFRLAVAITLASSPVVANRAEVEMPRGEWTGVSRVFAVGDIHGSYEKAIELLQGAGVIDENALEERTRSILKAGTRDHV